MRMAASNTRRTTPGAAGAWANVRPPTTVGGGPGRRSSHHGETPMTHEPAYDPLDTIRWMLDEARRELVAETAVTPDGRIRKKTKASATTTRCGSRPSAR